MSILGKWREFIGNVSLRSSWNLAGISGRNAKPLQCATLICIGVKKAIDDVGEAEHPI